MQYLETLNERQREAVTHQNGPLLVLAGAGSGKTRVIVHRIIHLIEMGVNPANILAVTFTNKAAKEMRDRLTLLTGEYLPAHRAALDAPPTVSTFHALGVRMLREHHHALGLRRQFAIYDRSDSNRAIKKALEAAGYSPKQFEPRRILGIISRAKGDALSLEAFAERAKSYPEQVAALVWRRYERILRDEQALDFDDLLLETLRMLREHPGILREYHERFSHIHVDEYQDTNRVQYEIARHLADNQVRNSTNICVVGDIDQNIYSWRGADIRNIMQFERHFPGTTVVILEENYRSTKTIIAASNSIIEKNTERVPKSVFTNNHDGEPLSLYVAYNETDEAEHVATTVRALIKDGAAPADIAVLFRANFQSRALEDAFLKENVPYQLLGTRFYERKEVRDILAYLRLVLSPENTGDLARVINTPARGIGKVTLLKILEGREDELTGATAKKVADFRDIIKDIAEYVQKNTASESIKFAMRRTGLEEELRRGGEEELERLENLRELVSLATRYDEHGAVIGLEMLLDDALLQSDQDELMNKEEQSAVKLMTVHASKGLEFPYVFIVGLEEGLFPHERLSDDRVDIEEERRLFYVALTRAEKKVFLSFAGVRTVFGSQRVNVPSSFLSDIDEAHLTSANPSESGYENVIEID